MQAQVRKNELASNALTRAGVNEIEAAQKQITNGFGVPADQWAALQAKFAGSPDPNIQLKLGELNAVRSELADFQGLPPAAIEARIASMESGLSGGATPQQGAIADAAKNYLTKYRADLAADPLGRAAKDGVIPGLAPIDFSGAQATAALAARVPAAAQAAQHYGLPATPYLTPDEKTQLKQIATQGGAPMLAAANSVVQALGPRAADLFREVGGDAPAFATAGRVAAWNGSQAFLQDFAERQRLNADPATKHALELPARNDSDAIANRALGDSLAAMPEMNASVRQAARDVFEVRALRDGLDKQVGASAARDTFTRGLQEAAGATFDGGVQYGGVGSYRPAGWWSSQPVLAPLSMRADGVTRAIGALTPQDLAGLPQPPVAGDLKTVLTPRQLQSATLTSRGPGVYWVSLGDPKSANPQWVMQPDGRKFTLSLNALEPALRQRIPEIYRGQ
jgi:hypothetical protein